MFFVCFLLYLWGKLNDFFGKVLEFIFVSDYCYVIILGDMNVMV